MGTKQLRKPWVRRLPNEFSATWESERRGRRPMPRRPEEVQRLKQLKAPLPWPRSTAEIMIDAMSVIKYGLTQQQLARKDIKYVNDLFSVWPLRVFMAAQALVGSYGSDRPPSPWRPIILVYDQPDPAQLLSGLKVRSWASLHKQGPRHAKGVTLGWAQTYVDRSAEENYRSDKEMLYMLELLTRDVPRRQVLVTDDKYLQRSAASYATVRSPEWFFQELNETGGEKGQLAMQALLGSDEGSDEFFYALPKPVKKAFALR